MARSQIARNVRLFVDQALSASAVSAHLASEARRIRDELVRSGQAAPAWRTIVDGQEGASEDTVKRVITYRFSMLSQAVAYALGQVQARSPVKSGAFRKSWFVVVDGERWTGELEEIPARAEVMVVNDRKYARKVDVGGMKMSVPPGIVEATRQAVQRAFPTVRAERDFVLLPGGYTLKGRGRSRRKDRAAGQPLTYPALVLKTR